MSYTLETSRHAGAYRAGRQGSAIDTIVIHHWGDPAGNPTFDGTADFFVRGGNTTSAHYVVEAGRVAQMVSDNDTAYHAGSWGMNLRSIGIECNPRCSDADKATVAELIRDLRAAHGNLRIIGHQDVISTDCPGRYYPPNTVLAPWLSGTVSATQTTTPAPQEEETMSTLMIVPTDEHPTWVYISDGITARHVPNELILADVAELIGEGLLKSIVQPTPGPGVVPISCHDADGHFLRVVNVRSVRSLDVVGKVIA
jgi:hypothetical protein